MRKFAKIALLSAFATMLQVSFAADIPWASSPEEVGMSSERLELINEVMQRHIDAGDIQGAVTAVARRGKLVHFEAVHDLKCSRIWVVDLSGPLGVIDDVRQLLKRGLDSELSLHHRRGHLRFRLDFEARFLSLFSPIFKKKIKKSNQESKSKISISDVIKCHSATR